MIQSAPIYTTKEAAEYLGVSASTLYRLEDRGILVPAKTPGGQRRYSQKELDRYKEISKSFEAPQKPYREKVEVEFDVMTSEMDNVFVSSSDAKDFAFENANLNVDTRNKLNELSGRDWIIETKSVWFQKGLGSNHEHAQYERMHPAPFSFQDIQRLISFFTKREQIVLDPFSGIGSTAKAALLLKRRAISIEISKKWIDLSKERIKREVGQIAGSAAKWINEDSRIALPKMESNSIDFIVTSPPYWSILTKKADHKVLNERIKNNLSTKYSEDADDLGNISDYHIFLNELRGIFIDCARVLKDGKYFAVIVSDFRHRSSFFSFHSDIIKMLDQEIIEESSVLKLQGTKILLQNHKKLYPYGYPFSYVENIHHQYILLFQKTMKIKSKAKKNA